MEQPKLNPNSYYHSMLVKRYGEAGAIKMLSQSNSYRALDMKSLQAIKSWKRSK